MITIEPFAEWKDRQVFEQIEADCQECGGSGDCECCARECLSCGGSGIEGIEDLPAITVERRYFNNVMDALSQYCAYAKDQDFLDLAGGFIKQHGRPGAIRHQELH